MQTSEINVERNIGIHLENKKISRSFFWFLWALYAIVCMTKNCYNSSLASIVSEGVLTKSQTGAITALFYLAYTPFQIVGGMVSDRYSPEKVIKIGLVGAAVANTIIFFCQNYYVMMATWVFNGIIQFGIWPCVFKIISSQLIRSDRPRMSFFISFSSTAGFLLSYLTGAVVSKWQYNFAISAISLVALVVALHIFEKIINPYMKWDKEEVIKTQGGKAEPVSKKKVFLASGFFFMILGMMLMVTVCQTRSSLTSVMLVENYETIAPSMGNVLTAVMLLAGLAGNLIAGSFMRYVKNEVLFIMIFAALKIPFLAACTMIGKLPVGTIITMLSVVACFDAVTDMGKTYYTMHFAKYGMSGTAAGILNAGNAFSYMLAAYVMPKIVELTSWQTMLVMFPIMLGISTISFAVIIPTFTKFRKAAVTR